MNLTQKMHERVMPFYQRGISGTMRGRLQVRLHYTFFEHPEERGAVILLPGKNGVIAQYAEAAFDIFEQGYSVYMLDHRGQGGSSRLGLAPDVSHVENFEYFILDLKRFFDEVVNAKEHAAKFLVAESMGGGIGTLYLTRFDHDFDAATFFVPMYEFRTPPFPTVFSEGFARVLCWFGRERQAVPLQPPFDSTLSGAQIRLTHDETRYRFLLKVLEDDPHLATDRTSVGWLATAFKATRELRRNAHRISTPILILQAGKDIWVTANAHREVARKARTCRIVHFPEAYHLIMFEREPIRSRAFSEMFEFFHQYAKGTSPRGGATVHHPAQTRINHRPRA